VSLALTATLAMLVQQAFATFTRGLVPVLAPAMGPDLGVDPSLAGLYAALAAAAALVGTLGVGGYLARYGALRVSQVALAIAAAGLAMAAPAGVTLVALGAIPVGLGSTISTPASSHLLARVVPPRQQPLLFSIKQTGVPVGVAMCGLLGPGFAALFGWRGALTVSALLCVALALALQPFRARFDADRDPRAHLGIGSVLETMRIVRRLPAMRTLAATFVVLVGLQFVFQTFLVVFLVERLGWTLGAAGALFSLATLVAIPARILWGAAGARFPARILLAIISAGSCVSFAALSPLTAASSYAAVLAAAVAGSATAMSWHGLMLAEIARLSPPGRAGAVTGAVLAFAQLGQIALPPIFGAMIAAGIGWGTSWIVLGLPAGAVAGWLLRAR
jgi:predicted MFS family arabinose efflux permease